MANIDLGTFLDFICGTDDVGGWIYVPVKKYERRLNKELWVKHFYRWPEERSKVVKFIEVQRNFHNVFVAPALFKSNESAEKHNVLGSWVAWADFDGDAPGTWEGNQPSLIVQTSGPRNQHVYFKFTEFCTDVDVIEAANRQLVKSSGDKSGVDASQVLRPVETSNRKRNEQDVSQLVYPHLPQVQTISSIGQTYTVQGLAYPSIAESIAWAAEKMPTTDKTRSDVFIGPLKDMVRDGVPDELILATAKIINLTHMPDHVYSDSSLKKQLENAKRIVDKEPADSFGGLQPDNTKPLTGKELANLLVDIDELGNGPEPKWLWYNLFRIGKVNLLAGDGYLGKSTFAVWLAVQAYRGDLEGEWKGQKKKTFWYNPEEHEPERIYRQLQLLGEPKAIKSPRNPLEELMRNMPVVEAMLRGDPEIGILVVDSVTNHMVGNRNAGEVITEYLRRLSKLATDYGICVLLLHHVRKGRDAGDGQNISGHRDWHNKSDVVWKIVRGVDGEVYMGQEKCRGAKLLPGSYRISMKEDKQPGWKYNEGYMDSWTHTPESLNQIMREVNREAEDTINGRDNTADRGKETLMKLVVDKVLIEGWLTKAAIKEDYISHMSLPTQTRFFKKLLEDNKSTVSDAQFKINGSPRHVVYDSTKYKDVELLRIEVDKAEPASEWLSLGGDE